MVELRPRVFKDLGRKKYVEESLPYAVVGGAWEGSFEKPLGPDEYKTVLSHIVQAGRQLTFNILNEIHGERMTLRILWLSDLSIFLMKFQLGTT